MTEASRFSVADFLEERRPPHGHSGLAIGRRGVAQRIRCGSKRNKPRARVPMIAKGSRGRGERSRRRGGPSHLGDSGNFGIRPNHAGRLNRNCPNTDRHVRRMKIEAAVLGGCPPKFLPAFPEAVTVNFDNREPRSETLHERIKSFRAAIGWVRFNGGVVLWIWVTLLLAPKRGLSFMVRLVNELSVLRAGFLHSADQAMRGRPASRKAVARGWPGGL
jgi:hypothetical protein